MGKLSSGPVNSWGAFPCARLHSENIHGVTVSLTRSKTLCESVTQGHRFRVYLVVAGANSSIVCVCVCVGQGGLCVSLGIVIRHGRATLILLPPFDAYFIYFTSNNCLGCLFT